MSSDIEKAGNDRSQLSSGSYLSDSSSCWSVEKVFVSFKIHYFLLNGAHVGVVPYLPVYAKSSLGCSATTVGLLATCMQFSSTVSKPLFGMLADYLNRMKILIGILLCLEIVVNMLMLLLPPIIEISSRNPSPTLDYSEKPVRSRKDLQFLRYAAAQPPHSVLDASKELYLQDSSLDQNLRIRRRSRSVSSLDRTYECHLSCGSALPDAVCYQPFRYCIDPQTANFISCSVARNISKREEDVALCKGLLSKSSRNFSLDYRIKTFYSQWDSRISEKIDVLPDSFTYYQESQGRLKRLACNSTFSQCSMRCESDAKFCAKDIDESHLYRTYQFWVFCVLALISAMCQGALYTLSDTACYEKLRGSKSDFGRQRLWAAVGWGTVAPLTGFLNDLVTRNSIRENYSSGWYIMAILSLVILLNLYKMDFPTASQSTSMFQDVRSIMVQRHFVLMEVNVFFMGVLNAYATTYVIWYMEMLGSSRVQMGLALAVDCLFGEAPFMYMSGWLISKLGHWHIVTLTFAAFGARFGAYYLISDPWLVLPIELLHGITFGLIYTTITSYGEQVSASGTGATIQGVLGGTYQGLGSGVGCLVAGLSFDRYGGRVSFLLIAIFSVCLALCHSAILVLFKPHRNEKQHEMLKDLS